MVLPRVDSVSVMSYVKYIASGVCDDVCGTMVCVMCVQM